MSAVKGDAAGPKRSGPRHLYDEALEFLLDIRMRVEAGQRRDRILLGSLSKILDVVDDAGPWATARGLSQEHLRKFAEVAVDLSKRNPPLLEGATPTERLASYRRLVSHAEGIWRDAVRLYETGSFPRSCFLAITCLEEVGKAVPARFTVKMESIYGALREVRVAAGPGQNLNPFVDHAAKHFLAAATGVRVNSRLEAILGSAELDQVLATMESKGLKEIRERCLYVDVSKSGRVIWPEEQITPELAKKWVIVAGEVLAEVLGFPDTEWERLVAAVREVESVVGIAEPGSRAQAP